MRLGLTTTILVSGLLWIATGGQASAQATVGTDAPPGKGWQVDVGAGAIAIPVFPGAKDERVLPIPSIEIHYGDRFFASVRAGVGYNVLRWNGLVAGPVANFAFPRNESDKRAALNGLGNVDFTLEAGGFVGYDYGQIASAKVEVRKGVNGHEGVVVDSAIELNAPPLDHNRLFLSVGPRLSYYDQTYAQAYYGVTAQQSSQSGYAAFRPGDGYKAGIGGAAVYLATPRVTLTAFGDYGRLLGDIGNSPIVRGRYGTRDQFTVGASVSYRFSLGG